MPPLQGLHDTVSLRSFKFRQNVDVYVPLVHVGVEKVFRKVALGRFLALKALRRKADQQRKESTLPIGISWTRDPYNDLRDGTRQVLDGPVHHKVFKIRGLGNDLLPKIVRQPIVEESRLEFVDFAGIAGRQNSRC